MPISGKISVAGVPRVPIQGADSAPVFRGEASATPAAPAETQGASAAAPVDEVAQLREAAAAAADQRKAAARDRAARAAEIKARDAELVRREEALKNIDARLRSYRTNPRAALADLAEFGLTFEDLAQAVAQGDITPEQRMLAELRQELEQVKSGAADAERRRTERETRERTTQVELETRAKRDFIADLGRTATGDPAKYPLAAHFGDAAFERGFEVAEDMLRRSGEIPAPGAVLDALERDLQKEIEAAWAARTGHRPQLRLSPGVAPSRSPGVRELEADRRARFLDQLSELLRKVR